MSLTFPEFRRRHRPRRRETMRGGVAEVLPTWKQQSMGALARVLRQEDVFLQTQWRIAGAAPLDIVSSELSECGSSRCMRSTGVERGPFPGAQLRTSLDSVTTTPAVVAVGAAARVVRSTERR